MYGKCVAQYLNNDFGSARRTVEGILRYNPENGRAKEIWEVRMTLLGREGSEDVMSVEGFFLTLRDDTEYI